MAVVRVPMWMWSLMAADYVRKKKTTCMVMERLRGVLEVLVERGRLGELGELRLGGS